ncbi:MAG: hypothetical protein ABUS48_03450 [Pseudomonadota bacterium]
MTTLDVRAPAALSARVRVERAESRLRRFPKAINARVRHLAARDPRLADLAVTFPALLAALAAPRRGFDAERTIARVLAGASLALLADEAAVPLWTRALPPEAFEGPVPALPAGPLFKRQIANHLPSPKKAAAWVKDVAFVYRWADEGIALWLARELTQPDLKKPKAPKRRYRPRRRPQLETERRLLVLWAWHSQRPETFAHSLIETPWRPEIGLDNANNAARVWSENVRLHLDLGDRVVDDEWFETAEIEGYTFAPLRTAAEVLQEARAMKNCLRTYGSSIAEGWSRVWSMRRDGERVATIELNFSLGTTLITLAQVRVVEDKDAPADILRIVQRWYLSQPETVLTRKEPAPFPFVPLDQKTWTKLWMPYWREKRPAWLPFRASTQAYYALT